MLNTILKNTVSITHNGQGLCGSHNAVSASSSAPPSPTISERPATNWDSSDYNAGRSCYSEILYHMELKHNSNKS